MIKKKVAIIGAGPAGLTAAYLLSKAGQDVTVFEADPGYVGGISRTETYKGNHFDIGGHRFFSKSQEVEDFWTEILGNDLLVRPRSSRIYYNHTFFAYPLAAREALKKLGVMKSFLCVFSYLYAKVFPVRNPVNFEDWVTNQFGRRLFNIFFKTYTEKVWGISCKEISADWAAQRIKGLSLSSAIIYALFPSRENKKGGRIKTLIDSFRYPRKGPGMMWEVCASKSQLMGASILKNTRVEKLYKAGDKWELEVQTGLRISGFDEVISSAPLREIVPSIFPKLNERALTAAKKLCYRDFITVILIAKEKNAFNDNWIYIHDPSVKVGRIQNFKSWSPEMVADPSQACYGLEYFCFDGDGLWNMDDSGLINLGKMEIAQIGLAAMEDISDGYVVRQKKAYPVYNSDYKQNVEIIKESMVECPGLQLVGRNGMHKYNNQDHSMMTAMLAVKNILAGRIIFDLWNVNEDASYHETNVTDEIKVKAGGRMIPVRWGLS
ncbi:MAG TPA: NAD(P)/FAD-dependent oxidoreductase [Puia sp.]